MSFYTHEPHNLFKVLSIDDKWTTNLDNIFHTIIDSYEARTELPDSDNDVEPLDLSCIGSVKEDLSHASEDNNGSSPPARIRTYTARKKEIEALLKELPQLESYLDLLKQKVGAIDEPNDVDKRMTANASLRHKVRQQQYLFARLKAALSLYVSRQERAIPFDECFRLGVKPTERIERLTALKPRMIRDAKRFIMERSAHMEMGIACKDQTHFVTPDGDYCALSFSVMPLRDVLSPIKVFETLLYYISNVEIVVSEQTGDVTIREEGDHASVDALEGISQERLVRYMAEGMTVESNHIVFSHYEALDAEYGDGRACGVIIVIPVDQDDLYPYSPTKLLRQDLTSVYTVKTYEREIVNAKKKKELRTEVVVTRGNFLKLHRSKLPSMSEEAMLAARDRLAQLGDVVCNVLKRAMVS